MRGEHFRSLLVKIGIAVGAIAIVTAMVTVGPLQGVLTSTSEEPPSSSEATVQEGETSSSTTGAQEEVAPAPAPPAAALLTVGDLPEGWAVELRGRQASTESVCGTAFDLAEGGSATPKIFFSKIPEGDYLAQGIVSYPEGGATATLQRLRELLDGCTEWVTGQADGSQQTWEASLIDMPAIGDEMVAVRLTGTLGDVALEATQLVIRRGDVLNTLAYIGGEGTADLIQPIATTADEKVAKALAG